MMEMFPKSHSQASESVMAVTSPPKTLQPYIEPRCVRGCFFFHDSPDISPIRSGRWTVVAGSMLTRWQSRM